MREAALRGDASDGATQTTILKYEAAGDTSATERNNHIQKGRNEKETVCRNLALLEQGRTRARNHKGRTHMPQKPCAATTPTITGREGGLRGDAFDGATQILIL